MVLDIVQGLYRFFGLDNGGGANYLFWSGIGSDFAELAILGAVIQAYRSHTCHVRGCWRIQRRKVAGTEHVVCHKHHPRGEPEHEDIIRDHDLANG